MKTHHPDLLKGESQKARLWRLLRDGRAYKTTTICKHVYGAEHLGIARISARVYDINKELENVGSKYRVLNFPHKGAITKYKLIEV